MSETSERTATAVGVPNIPVERFELKCGALLLASHRPGAPVCALQAHMRGGHSLDPVGLEGLASMSGRLVDQGTERHDEQGLAALLEGAGGSLQGGSTGLAGEIAADSWKLLVELFCECLTEPTYPLDRVRRQAKRVIDRLLVEQEDPRVQGARKFRRLVYGDHWLGRSDVGTPESIARITRRNLSDFHRKNWCGKRTVIAFCGDVEPATVKRYLDRHLRDWKPGNVLPPADQNFPPIAPRSDAYRAERQQVHVYLGHLGIRRKDPDYATLVTMDYVLGTGPGFTNRISRKLRDELGLAYTVDASIHSSAGVLPGIFTAYIGTSPEHLTTAVQGFLTEIRRIQDKLVGRAELELAKRYLTGSFALGFERASRRAHHLVAAQRNGLEDGHLGALVESFEAVTAADVRAAARKHLHPDRPCLVVAGPVDAREVKKALAAR